jgi:hypothetical protein
MTESEAVNRGGTTTTTTPPPPPLKMVWPLLGLVYYDSNR